MAKKNDLKKDIMLGLGVGLLIFAVGLAVFFGGSFSVTQQQQNVDVFEGFTDALLSLLIASSLGIAITVIGVRVAGALASRV